MLDRVRIWTLRQAGHTLDQIATAVGVGKRSVQRILKEPPIRSPESAPTPASRRIGRPSRVEALQDRVEVILQVEPSLPPARGPLAQHDPQPRRLAASLIMPILWLVWGSLRNVHVVETPEDAPVRAVLSH
jgi:hypothetical protein